MRKRGPKTERLKIHLKTGVIWNMLAKKRLNPVAYAKLVGVAPASIRGFLTGEMNPAPETLGAMADALGLEPYHIAEGLEPVKEIEREDGVVAYLEKHPDLAKILYRLASNEGFIDKINLE